ncbi:MAG: DUF1311 domain-containing protein [Maricaulaceae bacterium]|nr:DUF1311 domain-containing protein [Maricaulaceae bacterium]
MMKTMLLAAGLALGVPGAAAANPYLEPGRAAAEIEACLADSGVADGCNVGFFTDCAEAGGWTTHATIQCDGAAGAYWQTVVDAREAALRALGGEPAAWTARSRAAWESYREARCARFLLAQGTMYLQMHAGCLTQMTLERAEDLAEFAGDEPLILLETE